MPPKQPPLDLLRERIKALQAERARVEQARQRAVELALKASQDKNLQGELFKTVLPDESSYCSTRSCEIERAAGYTLPSDFKINNKSYKAGDKIPIIPGTKQFGSNAEKMGYRKIAKDQMQPGDRLFLGDLPLAPGVARGTPSDNPMDFYHSMIFGGYDDNNTPIYYYDQGPGRNDTFIRREGYYKPEEIGAVYRYEGALPSLEEEVKRLRRELIMSSSPELTKASTEKLKAGIRPSRVMPRVDMAMTTTPGVAPMTTPSRRLARRERRTNTVQYR
jgi:hypothetical protein